MSELTWRQQRARIEILEYRIERLRGLLREALPHIYIPDDCDRTDEIRDKIDAALAVAPEAK